jgi:uncharacterized RDD family membrane protein YckC
VGTTAYRHCPQCGSEYQAWVERCFDCDVSLGAPVSSDLPPPDIVDKDEPDRRTTSVDIDDLSGMQRERLRMLLRGPDIRFEMTADQLWFPEGHAGEVDDLLEDVRGIVSEDDSIPPRRRELRESRARPDRKIVRPKVEPSDDEPFEYASAWPRGLAKIIDAWLIGIAFGLYSLVLEPIPYATWIFLVALFASLESIFGRTPGKAIVGIRVENLAGEPPSLPAAMLRNAWQLVALVPALGPWLTLVAHGGIGWLIRQEPMHRGPHDLIAHTFVVRSREPIRRRLISSERSRATRERHT